MNTCLKQLPPCTVKSLTTTPKSGGLDFCTYSLAPQHLAPNSHGFWGVSPSCSPSPWPRGSMPISGTAYQAILQEGHM